MSTERQRESIYVAKSPTYVEKSPIYVKKSPIYVEKSHIYVEKSPFQRHAMVCPHKDRGRGEREREPYLFSEMSPIFPQKSPNFFVSHVSCDGVSTERQRERKEREKA